MAVLEMVAVGEQDVASTVEAQLSKIRTISGFIVGSSVRVRGAWATRRVRG